MTKNPYPGGNPGGVLKNNGGPKAGPKSNWSAPNPGTRYNAPGPDRNMGNSQNSSSDYSLDQHFDRGSNTEYSKRKPGLMRG